MCSGANSESSFILSLTSSDSLEELLPIPNHKVGLQKVADMLLHPEKGVIQSTSEIGAVGHRVVHGGSYFSDTTIITEEVKDKIKDNLEWYIYALQQELSDEKRYRKQLLVLQMKKFLRQHLSPLNEQDCVAEPTLKALLFYL